MLGSILDENVSEVERDRSRASDWLDERLMGQPERVRLVAMGALTGSGPSRVTRDRSELVRRSDRARHPRAGWRRAR